MLRDFDQRGGWSSGFRSCAHWLNWRTGLELGAAREKVRVAHALATLPRLSAAMARGEISFSKVRALTRVATPANEEELLTFAKAGTAAHVEKVVRAWRRVDRLAEQEHEQLRHASRYLRAYTDEDGMVVVQARLAPEAETSRRLACDAALVMMRHAADGSVLDVGRHTRAIPTPLRRALARRDAGCRFPGCASKLCDAHHLQHWADGGKTKLENLVQLCRYHHRAVHEEGFRVRLLPGGELRFFRPDGRPLADVPSLPALGADPLISLKTQLATRGIVVDREAALPSWDGTPLDLAWAVDRLRPVGAATQHA